MPADAAFADLHLAVAARDPAGVAAALAAGADPSAHDGLGDTALTRAAAIGDAATIAALLAGGAAVDASSRHGNTALMIAAAHGHAPIVRRLRAAGARVDAHNKWGLDARRWSEWAGDRTEIQHALDG